MATVTLETASEQFAARFAASGELSRSGGRHIPGGYSRNSLTFGPHAIYVERGDGAFIHTAEGLRLLDFHNNFSCNIAGHDHPHVRKALLDLVQRGYSFGNPMRHEHRLAEMLCERVASVERVIFSCSASESCLSAIRIARANTGKDKVAKFEGGYHGLGDDFMLSLHPFRELFPGPANNPIAVPNTAGIPRHVRENVVVLPQNDLESCGRILRARAAEIACVIMELQTGAGGVITLERDFVQGIRELTHELGIVMIIDETITLRAGYHGMQGLYEVQPDLTVFGKMIGGGVPIGAVGGRAEYFRIAEEGMVYHSGTHHGHPLATAAGIATLEVMDQGAYAKLNTQADRIRKELGAWATAKGYPFIVYGVGSHLGYEITDGSARTYRSCRDMIRRSVEPKMQTFAFEMANRGVFPMYRGQIALSQPMTDDDIETFIGTAQSVLGDMF
jgi:glutamate-1-semialdehyde 2,1-aminomutase